MVRGLIDRLSAHNFSVAFLLVLCMLSQSILFANTDKLELIETLNISSGLSHNGVTCILEDSKGYLWVGTYDGLNRYDGYEFKIFKNTLDRDIILSNRIRSLVEDDNGNIWIGTDEGLVVYDYRQEKFLNIYSNQMVKKRLQGPIIRSIVETNGKTFLCITEDDGVLEFNSSFELIRQYQPPSSQFRKYHVNNGMLMGADILLLNTSIGIIQLALENGSFKQLLSRQIRSSVASVIIDDKTLLLARSYGLAEVSYRILGDQLNLTLNQLIYTSSQFRSMAIDAKGGLWLGTSNQGLVYLKDPKVLLDKGSPPPEIHAVTGMDTRRVSCFNTKPASGCWMGTFDKGLFRFSLTENPFKFLDNSKGLKNGPSSNSISGICPLDDNRAYLSVNLGGIGLFNPSSKTYSPLPFKIPSAYRLTLGSVFIDSKGNYWISRGGGYEYFQVKSGTKVLKKLDLSGFPSVSLMGTRSVVEDKDGFLWFGTAAGILRLTVNNNSDIVAVEKINNHPFFDKEKMTLVRFVYYDKKYDLIWVGTDKKGLYRIKVKKGQALDKAEVHQYTSDKHDKYAISSNFVTSIIRLPNDDFWVGTEQGGICKVLDAVEEPKFLPFGEKQGLSNNVVKSILYDDEYNLWISTNVGLNKFNTKDKWFRVFKEKDGLPFDGFEYGAAFLKSGYMLLAGEGGLCYFDPRNLNKPEGLPPLTFGSLQVLNKVVEPGDSIDGRVILSSRLDEVEGIELKYNENVFTVEMTSLHFSNPDNHFIKYRLSPLNEDWIVVPASQRFAYFNGLQPGEYVLEAMASNALNEWTMPKQLRVVIKPPIWKTPWALASYVLFSFLMVYIVIRVLMRMQSLKHSVDIQQLEKNKAEEMNEAKMRFFSNISHEIKTPLTLISGPLELLLKRFEKDEDVAGNLELVRRQSKKMSQLVDQVHDFRRSDKNVLKMHYSEFVVNDLLQELMLDFDYLAKINEKQLKFITPGKNVMVHADKDKLEKVFNNLLNNAFKFTEAGDVISVEFFAHDQALTIKVSDTGRGIDADDLPYVFERFYQSQKKHSAYTGGSGIGLAFSKRLVEMHYGKIWAESELGKGASFVVELPIVEKVQAVEVTQKVKEIISAEKDFDQNASVLSDKEGEPEFEVENDLQGAVVYLAEDNDDMRIFVQTALSRHFKVKAFPNGKKCLEAMEHEWPDIIVSDVLMPELNGFDLTKSIKSDIKTSHIPIVLLTACVQIEDQILGLKNGADAYIKKPFNVQHLLTRIETLLKNRKVLRERYQSDFPHGLEKKPDNTSDNVFLEKLYGLMAENLDNQDLDLNSFAKELYLNRTHFYHKVKALTNETPYELLKIYRLKKAAEMLVQQKLQVTEVCMLTGFKSRTHFSKLFKDKYGVTPSKYANEKRDK